MEDNPQMDEHRNNVGDGAQVTHPEQEALSVSEVPGWRPIETAPDGPEVLVLRRDGLMHVARVSGFGDRKYGILNADFGNASCHFFFPVGGNCAEDDDAPTHWMPLPAPPVSALRAASEASQ